METSLGPLISATINGITYGATLFLVAVGLSLVFGVLRVLNVAHGSFYAIGAFTAASAWVAISTLQLSPWLIYPALFVGAALIGAVIGPLVERFVLRWTYRAGSRVERENLQLLATYAAFLILEDVQKLVWGAQPYYSGGALQLLGNTSIGGIPYTNYQLLLVPVAIILVLGLRWALRHTVTGKFVVAVQEHPEMAAAMGINVGWIYTISFAVGAALAALGGALSSPTIGVSVGIGAQMIVLSFAVVAVAGLGQIEGAAVAALVIGIAYSMAVFFFAELSSVVPYLIMVAVLLARPYGLFGVPEKRRI